MHILHIITGLRPSGAELVLYRLILNDHRNTHSVISLTQVDEIGTMLIKNGVDVYALEMQNFWNYAVGVLRLFSIVYKIQFDLIQSWMYHADVVASCISLLTGKPVYWGVRNGTLSVKYSKSHTFLALKFCSFISHRIPKKIISCSNSAANTHVELGYDKARFIVIPNGFDTEIYKPNSASRLSIRSELSIPASLPVIGFVARFDPQKNHGLFLESASKALSSGIEFKILLVGRDMSSKNYLLSSMIKRYSLSNHVITIGPQRDIPSIMNCIDLLVSTSSFGEAFPNVLAEAMACGTPCLSTDVGDSRQIIGDTGWIVSSYRPEEISVAIYRALLEITDDYAWNYRQQRCRQRILSNYTIEDMVSGYNKIWVGDNSD